jgi:hypothetical protein
MTREKIAGVKARLAADTGGLPHAVRMATANVTDRDGALETLRVYAPNLLKAAKVLRGGGYSGENFASAVRLLLEAGVVKRNEPCAFAWLEKYRRLWENGKRKIQSTRQMTLLAFIALLLRRF